MHHNKQLHRIANAPAELRRYVTKIMTSGTEGYKEHILHFVEISQSLEFKKVCKDFIKFLPSKNSNVLDLGSGAGQNSAALDKLGFNVTAVEPLQELLDQAQSTYQHTSVNWLNGSMPDMVCLETKFNEFDFILIDGVWHHLDEMERAETAKKLAEIIRLSGKCAISLRNGPAGMGTNTYPTDLNETVELFENYDFECIFSIQNQASILPNKEKVTWARIVLEKH